MIALIAPGYQLMMLRDVAQRGYGPASLLDPPDDCHSCGEPLPVGCKRSICKKCDEMLKEKEFENCAWYGVSPSLLDQIRRGEE